MRLKKMQLMLAIVIIAGFLSTGFLKPARSVVFGTMLMEMVNIHLNCTTATVEVTTVVSSNDTSLVHFPTNIDLTNPVLSNATAITLGFAGNFSVLTFTFKNIDNTAAKLNADTVKPDLEAAFDVSFTYNSTETHDGYVDVIYMGEGQSNLVGYTEWLMDQCLNATIEGFSLTFPVLASKPNAMTSIFANKKVGDFNWGYTMSVHYTASIPTGSGTHTIDVLELLNVSSLAPSSYALIEGAGYVSMVRVNVYSNETVTFQGCVPSETTYPMTRGWYVPLKSGALLSGTFYFGNDQTAVEELTFTFSGAVIPEFTAVLPLIAFLVATMTIIKSRRKS